VHWKAGVTLPDPLIAANRSGTLETVLRWMLHDARNPIQTLAFLPALVEAGASGTGDVPEWQQAVAGAADRLTTTLALLDRLIGSGPVRTAPEPVGLNDSLGFVADLFRARRGRFRVDLAGARSGTLPAVSAIRHELDAALLNLTLNAAEATAEAGGCVTAHATVRPGLVELALDDDGPGVSESLRNRLFEPYVTSRSDSPGRGLGLYAARQRLAGFGGTVRYEPQPRGSRFVVSLPQWSSRAAGT
jgi:signal transduction histidine kinase